MQYIHHYASPLGPITAASDGEALTGLWFDGQKYFAAGLGEHEERELPIFSEVDRWLDAFFSGHDPGFTPQLRPRGTAFRRAVCRNYTLKQIHRNHLPPYGGDRWFRK